jgi:hypothetical protein
MDSAGLRAAADVGLDLHVFTSLLSSGVPKIIVLNNSERLSFVQKKNHPEQIT